MLAIDLGIAAAFVMPLFLWLRGVWKRNLGDSGVALLMFAVMTAGYFYFYAYISWTGLPWISLAAATAGGAAIVLLRQKDRRGWAYPLVALCLAGAAFLAERAYLDAQNSLLVIMPYRSAGTWRFDEPRLGLHGEPFVNGIPQLIDKLVEEAKVPNADKGFRLIFSARPFPGCQDKVIWRRAQDGGNWYYSEKYDMEGWLCPALFKYFKRAPKEIYVKAEAK